jgi:hypothetical protein
MNVFEDLIGELKEEQLLEETIINLSTEPPSVPNAAPGAEIEPDDDYLVEEADTGHLTDEVVESGTSDFFRKRAVDEVSTMQMVEHVLAGIEGEYYRTVAPTYDDLVAKKALHRFLHIDAEPDSTEYAEAESALLTETEAWSSALYRRDENISVASLRRFCESCRPVLSSQALVSLSRFYRNGPFCAEGRQKFEYVMTRLFSREVEDQKRKLLFERRDMISHIKNLYASWSSVSMFEAHEEETAVKAIVEGFAEYVGKSRSAEGIEQLFESDYFKNLNALKDAANELFFVPEVTGAAIECNVRVGNRFIDLARKARSDKDLANVQEVYGYTHDQIVSEAAGRTLRLIDHLKSSAGTDDIETLPPSSPVPAQIKPVEDSGRRSSLLKVNKWLLLVTLVVVAGSVGLYVWADRASTPDTATLSANKVDLGGTDLAPYLRTGRTTSSTFYAITLPAWDSLPEEQKKQVVQNAVGFAKKMRLGRVQLLNYKGRSVAFGSDEKVELIDQN